MLTLYQRSMCLNIWIDDQCIHINQFLHLGWCLWQSLCPSRNGGEAVNRLVTWTSQNDFTMYLTYKQDHCTWAVGKRSYLPPSEQVFFFFSSFATFSLHLGIHISKLLDHGQMKYLFHPHRHFLKEHISLECSIRRICRQILLWH